MTEQDPASWLLCDCPSALDDWDNTIALAGKHSVRLILRAGVGLDPFFLMGRAATSGVTFGLWVHLRDLSATTLTSDLRTAVSLGIDTMIICDPPPPPTGTQPPPPIGAMNMVDFLAAARRVTGATVRFGTVNRAAHPADLRLLQKMLEAGCGFAAVPPAAWQGAITAVPALRQVVRWHWCRPGTTAGDAKHPTLIELADAAEPFAVRLARRLGDAGAGVATPETTSRGAVRHASTLVV